MTVGKRTDTNEPLTEHDVAERLSNALLRVWRIVADLNGDPELASLVRSSRFLTVHPAQVRAALGEFLGATSDDEPEPEMLPIRWCPRCGEAVAGVTTAEADLFASDHCDPNLPHRVSMRTGDPIGVVKG